MGTSIAGRGASEMRRTCPTTHLLCPHYRARVARKATGMDPRLAEMDPREVFTPFRQRLETVEAMQRTKGESQARRRT